MKDQSYSLNSQKKKADIFCIRQVTLQKQVHFLFLEGYHELSMILRNSNFSHGKDKPIAAGGNTSKELAKLKFILLGTYPNHRNFTR